MVNKNKLTAMLAFSQTPVLIHHQHNTDILWCCRPFKTLSLTHTHTPEQFLTWCVRRPSGKNTDNMRSFSVGTGGAAWHIINQSKLNNNVSTLAVAAYDLIHEHGSRQAGGVEVEKRWAESDKTPHITHVLRCGRGKHGNCCYSGTESFSLTGKPRVLTPD